MYLFLDTETTGFPNPNIAPRDPKQGRVCQIALILTDENNRNIAEFSSLIAPDGWTIQAGAQGVHGISDELCGKYGIKSRTAFQLFQRLAEKVDIVVAHNLDFDMRMLEVESAAHDLNMPFFKNRHCTMKAATPLCKLPKARGPGYKWPKLGEALPMLCGRELGDDAHDAMVDTRGCKDLFFELRERGLFQPAKPLEVLI